EKLFVILKRFRELKRLVTERPFDAIVLIDFPDFNLRFAKKARGLGIPIIYYISPQVWAWRKKRIRKIARLVDKMLVVFPFEFYLYKEAGVDVEYVGHPLADIARCGLTRGEARSSLGLSPDDTVVSLLPGSRTGEVKRMLGVMLESAEKIRAGLGNGKKARFLIPAARGLNDAFFDGLMKGEHQDVRLIRDSMYEALRASDASVVASGTATLETALIGTPMVIVYRMSPVSYGIARMLVNVENIGLPNIVAGARIVPELIQNEASPENISREVLGLLRDEKRRARMVEDMTDLRKNLGRGGAADKAARAVYRIMRPEIRDENGVINWISQEEPVLRK
ncbi:MAG: lipid-A-disaccharide synthase, partial [Deltaproteobacteria bacterium]|nr:lipid-A-disaccharide synthase [Deltaproteobacteria bacterium]